MALGGSQEKRAIVALWRNILFVLKDQICDLERSLGQSETWVQLFPQLIDEDGETQRG